MDVIGDGDDLWLVSIPAFLHNAKESNREARHYHVTLFCISIIVEIFSEGEEGEEEEEEGNTYSRVFWLTISQYGYQAIFSTKQKTNVRHSLQSGWRVGANWPTDDYKWNHFFNVVDSDDEPSDRSAGHLNFKSLCKCQGATWNKRSVFGRTSPIAP